MKFCTSLLADDVDITFALFFANTKIYVKTQLLLNIVWITIYIKINWKDTRIVKLGETVSLVAAVEKRVEQSTSLLLNNFKCIMSILISKKNLFFILKQCLTYIVYIPRLQEN